MKTSALACYLESIANAIRSSKEANVPHIKWTSFKGPTVLHVGSVNIPVPDHKDCPDLVCLFPQVTRQDADAKQEAKADAYSLGIEIRNEREAWATRVRNLEETNATLRATVARHEHQMAADQSAYKTELASVRADLKAADQTLTRMRSAHVVAPSQVAPVRSAPVVPTGDLLSAIMADAETPEQRDHREFIASLPPVANLPGQRGTHGVQFPAPVAPPVLVLTFPMNGQGKTLAAAAVTLPELRDLFTFHFNDNRDATRGGYWLAKNPTGPHAQELARTLAKEGATVGTQLPLALAR